MANARIYRLYHPAKARGILLGVSFWVASFIGPLSIWAEDALEPVPAPTVAVAFSGGASLPIINSDAFSNPVSFWKPVPC